MKRRTAKKILAAIQRDWLVAMRRYTTDQFRRAFRRIHGPLVSIDSGPNPHSALRGMSQFGFPAAIIGLRIYIARDRTTADGVRLSLTYVPGQKNQLRIIRAD